MISEYSKKGNPVKIQDIGPMNPASLHQRTKANVNKKKTKKIKTPMLFFVFSIFGFSFSTEISKKQLGILTIPRRKRMIRRGE